MLERMFAKAKNPAKFENFAESDDDSEVEVIYINEQVCIHFLSKCVFHQ